MNTASDTAPAAQGSLGRGADDPIRARRAELNISRTELALGVDVGKSTIAGIENGHHRPSLELARKIAEALNSDVRELFTLQECECGCGELMVDRSRRGSSARFLPGHNCRGPEHGPAVARAHRARRARLGIPEEKICERCGETFTRSDFPRQSDAGWIARKFCSGDCRWPVRAQERHCEQCGELIPRKVMSDNRNRQFCSRRCGQLNRWKRGAIAAQAVAQLPGRARRVWKLRWTRSPGRGRSYNDEKAAWVRSLTKQGYTIGRTAEIVGLSRDTVRRIRNPEKRS